MNDIPPTPDRSTPPPPTQVTDPRRTTIRTVFQAVVGLCAMWALVIEAAGIDDSTAIVSASLAFTGAVARVMALPAVNSWIETYLPFLAATPPKR